MAVRALSEDRHQCCASCTRRLEYARAVADSMALRDWTVQVAHDAPRDDRLGATAQIATGRKLVLLRFADEIETLDPAEYRHRVVHELAHALVQGVWESVESITDELAGVALRMFLSGVQREMERLVDQIATVTAPAVPLPWEE